MPSESIKSEMIELQREFEEGAGYFPDVDLHMIYAGLRYEDCLDHHPFPNRKRNYGPTASCRVYEEITNQDGLVELHTRRKYWLQGDDRGVGQYMLLANKIGQLLAGQQIENVKKESLLERLPDSRWMSVLFDLVWSVNPQSSLYAPRLVWTLNNEKPVKEPWHPNRGDYWYSRINHVYRASVSAIDLMRGTYRGDQPQANAVPTVDPHAPYMPADWFKLHFGIEYDRLYSAKRRKAIAVVNHRKRYRYSVPDAQKEWPSDGIYIPPTNEVAE